MSGWKKPTETNGGFHTNFKKRGSSGFRVFYWGWVMRLAPLSLLFSWF